MLVLYVVAMFVAGSMLFLVQPMFARMVLPLLGGSPAVWNTAMVFYQVMLLAGYLYAHASRRWLSARQQVAVHLALLLMPFLVLPMAVPAQWIPPGGANPVPWLLALLMVGAGLPFFVVSSTSPLLQSWFARSDHPSASKPYALYAASNAGSMLALLSYPFLIEPNLALATQSRFWSWGYGLLAILIAACALQSWRGATTVQGSVASRLPMRAADVTREALSVRRRVRWVLLAFVPSSLMLSVTMYMSTNIAPLPLLWVLPLSIYLLTFILAFASRRLYSRALLIRALPFVLLPLLIMILMDASRPIRPLIALHLTAFGVIALLCHSALADDTPKAESLTEFYLWLSVGGALGGVFNALLAPLLFTTVLEYPFVLALAALLLPTETPQRGDDDTGDGTRAAPMMARTLDIALPITLAGLVLLADVVVRNLGITSEALARLLTFSVASVVCFAFAPRAVRFALGIAAIVGASVVVNHDDQEVYAERSFFGVIRILAAGDGQYHQLVHGSISHGLQSLDSLRRREPLTYYTASGPAGELIRARQIASDVRRVAVVGLGAGSLACYRQPGEAWTFFEIDAVVLHVAQDPRYFTFLRDCTPDALIRLGDARLSLAQEADASYDLIVLDAYSGDAVPVHLLTREALALYQRKLAPGGLIALHVSNLFFNLAPVVAALAQDAGLVSIHNLDMRVTAAQEKLGKTASEWIVLARRAADVAPVLASDTAWQLMPRPVTSPVWTDDFSSTLRALK